MAGHADDLDLLRHPDALFFQGTQNAQPLQVHRGQDGIQLRLVPEKLVGALIAILKAVDRLGGFGKELLQPVGGDGLGVALVPALEGALVGVTGDERDAAAAFGIEIVHGVPAAGFVVGYDAADAWLLTPHDLGDGDAAGLDAAQQPVVAPGAGDDDAVHEAVLHPFQTAFFPLGVIVGGGDQGGIPQPFGFVLDARQDLREQGQVEPGHDDPQGVPPSLPQRFCHDIGSVAQLLSGSHDAGFGLRVDIRGIV